MGVRAGGVVRYETQNTLGSWGGAGENAFWIIHSHQKWAWGIHIPSLGGQFRFSSYKDAERIPSGAEAQLALCHRPFLPVSFTPASWGNLPHKATSPRSLVISSFFMEPKWKTPTWTANASFPSTENKTSHRSCASKKCLTLEQKGWETLVLTPPHLSFIFLPTC